MLETRIDGSPSSLNAAAAYLNGAQVTITAWSSKARSAAASAGDLWSGQAAGLYLEHTLDGAAAGDEAARACELSAQLISTLTTVLTECQQALADVRRAAKSAGLLVIGTRIYPPERAVWSVYQDPDATPEDMQEALVHDQAWQHALDVEYRARRTWRNAVMDFVDDAFSGKIPALLGAAGVATDTGMAVIKARVAFYRSSVDVADQFVSNLSKHIDAFTVNGVAVGPKAHFYELMDERDLWRMRGADFSDALDAAKKVGSRLAKASGVLGALGVGYGTYVDIADGESVTQALVSNGVDWGVAAGFMAGGAAIGSFIAPPIGTVVGGLVGGVVGIFAGGFGNGVVDHLMEDVSPDFAGAISAGWDEVVELGESFGDLVTGLWDSIF